MYNNYKWLIVWKPLKESVLPIESVFACNLKSSQGTDQITADATKEKEASIIQNTQA